MAETIPGKVAVEQWLTGLSGFEHARVLGVYPLDGGASNITCRVTIAEAARTDVVVRVQRDHGIFEPYDVVREGEVLRRLRLSRVPVPELLGSERDAAVLGAPFIVMEWIDAPHMGVAGAEGSYSAFTAAVAEIHAVPWRALGLGFLGVPASIGEGLARELDAIEKRQRTFVPGGEPLLEGALKTLRRTIPEGGAFALCQGDINIFNYLFRKGEVVAVVDWEQARISDRRSDVGQLVALSHLKGAPFCPAADAPFVRMYEDASGWLAGDMEWFRARWLWELGVIYHGWRAFNGSEPWYSWDDLAGLLEASLGEL